MEVLFYIVLLVLFMGILASLMIPVSVRFDSTEKYFNVDWMSLSLTRLLRRKGPRRPREKPEKKRHIIAIGRFLLRDRNLGLEIFQRGYRSVTEMVQSVSIREMEANLSTPDPMWNGVLSGVFANIELENVSLSTNFQNINSVKGRLQVYPYKIIKVVTGFLVRLPYRRIIKAALHTKKR